MRPIRVPSNRASFYLGVTNGILFHGGSAMFDVATVVAVFMQRLTDSSMLVGLMYGLVPFGWQAPQLWEARYLETKSRKLGTYRVSAAIRICALLALSGTVWALADHNRLATLVSFVVLYTAYCLVSGVGGLAFMDIVGKTIPGNYLGSFFGARQLGGGALAAAAGYFLVRPLLKNYGFPQGYITIFIIGTALLTVSLLCFAFVPEPPGVARATRRSLVEYLRHVFAAFKRDRNLWRLLRLRLVMPLATIGMPFYVVFCVKHLGAGEGMVGVYLTAMMVGMVVSNLIFAPMADRRGHHRPIIVGTACIATATTLAALLSWLPVSHHVAAFSFLPVVLSFSVGQAGLGLGTSSYVLEYASSADRPLYVGSLNTLTAPLAFTPVLGGLIVQRAGYQWAFLLTALASALAFALATRLREIEREEVE